MLLLRFLPTVASRCGGHPRCSLISSPSLPCSLSLRILLQASCLAAFQHHEQLQVDIRPCSALARAQRFCTRPPHWPSLPTVPLHHTARVRFLQCPFFICWLTVCLLPQNEALTGGGRDLVCLIPSNISPTRITGT